MTHGAASQFGPLADDYARSRSHAQGRTLDLMLAAATPGRSDDVVDVATGAGHCAHAFAHATRLVLALDPAHPMVVRTLDAAREKGLANVRGVVAVAERLPLRDATFDIVTCRTAAHHFDDPLGALREMCRVLRAGGRLILSDMEAADERALRELQHEVETLHDATHVRTWTKAEWREACEIAGFADVRVTGGLDDGLTELPEGTNLAEWCHRSRTPPESEARIRQLLTQAPDRHRQALRVEGEGPSLSFAIYKLVVAARRP